MCLSVMSTSSSESDIEIDAFGLEPYQYEPDAPDSETGAERGIVSDEDERQRRIGNTEW